MENSIISIDNVNLDSFWLSYENVSTYFFARNNKVRC